MNQDYISQTDARESDMKKRSRSFNIEAAENDFRVLDRGDEMPIKMTDREILVGTLLQCGFDRDKIRKILKMRSNTFRNLMYSLRKKMMK